MRKTEVRSVSKFLNEDEVAAIFERAEEQYGGIDILVNNAGIIQYDTVERTSLKDWQRILAINLTGPFLCSRAVSPRLKKQKWGKIVNLGSSAGKTGGSESCAAYSVSKAGLMCLTKSQARELAPYQVNVNAVAPTLIETEMIKGTPDLVRLIPLGRLGKTEEVADVVAFLCSDNASFLTGEIVDVNGGFLMD